VTASPAEVATAEAGLDRFLARERERVDAALAAAAESLAEGAPAVLREAIGYALATPGKRLRPILCAAAYRVASGTEPPEAAYRLAAAVEVLHTYSLVHDDLPCMDDDALRRGRPTVHVAFTPTVALLAGGALIPAAVRLLDGAARELGVEVATRGRLVVELCTAAGGAGMVAGQWLDLAAEDAGVRVGPRELERIHRLKTGALLAASLRIGALAAGADARLLDALSVYGREVGLAFQIVDDLLDVTRTDAELGKTAGKDRAAGKATYPLHFGVEGARRMAAERIAAALAALAAAGARAPELEALAAYVLERGR
jgi:geranylgeranyl pyrophosphate synthase